MWNPLATEGGIFAFITLRTASFSLSNLCFMRAGSGTSIVAVSKCLLATELSLCV